MMIVILNTLPLFVIYSNLVSGFESTAVHEIRKYKSYDIACFGHLICRAPISLQVRGVGEGSGSIARQVIIGFCKRSYCILKQNIKGTIDHITQILY